MKLIELMKRAFAKADDGIRAAFEAPEETNARRAGLPKYSRHQRNPAWGDRAPGPGDRVVGRQVVAPDSAPPPGERFTWNEWSVVEDYSTNGEPSNVIGAEFYAARQALVDRRTR